MESWLAVYGNRVNKFGSITSVFGFVEFTPLYGGRLFKNVEITSDDMAFLSDNNINLRLPLTNMFVDEEMYEDNRWFLDKFYGSNTSILCSSDFLARRIREDYPDYKLEASAVMDIHPKDVAEYLKLYDTVVLPPSMSDKYELLEKIQDKHRVTVFGRGGCAYNCPSKICYPSISKAHKNPNTNRSVKCSKNSIPREELPPFLEFDLEKLSDIGFSNFKFTSSVLGWST
jgi:collagenase-like PrtC family protease